MEYEIKFQEKEDAMRKENSFIDKYKDYNYSDVHIKGSMLYVTTYDGNPWWFDFKRSN